MDVAERIFKEVLHETAGIWYIADEYGEKVMVKATSNAVKSIIAGCKIDFLFGKDSQHIFPIFHTGIRIHDDPVHYLRLTSVQRFRQEHHAIKRIMELETVNIHLHNELTMCMATATLTISRKDREKVISLLGNLQDLYSGDYNHHTIQSLDCFDYSIDKDPPKQNVKEIPIIIVDGNLNNFIIMDNIFIGMNEKNHVLINDQKEGEVFEKQIWVTLEQMFLQNVHRNPQITDKYGFRELTDVLAFHQYGSFLIETKALSVLDISRERHMDRKVAGLQKQILTGIGQMKGAAKRVAKNVNVFNNKGELLNFDRSIIPHCIVLVSELLPFGDWKKVEKEIIQAMIDQPMYLNVMDLREFMLFIGYARGSKERLDASLMDRVEKFIELRDIHMRVSGEKFDE